jgi:hypothetical protein
MIFFACHSGRLLLVILSAAKNLMVDIISRVGYNISRYI